MPGTTGCGVLLEKVLPAPDALPVPWHNPTLAVKRLKRFAWMCASDCSRGGLEWM